MSQEKKKKARKISSAEKRCLQSKKRKLANRSFRSQIATAVKAFRSSAGAKEAPSSTEEKLRLVCSLVDKAVKRGVYKKGKASRTKSRLSLLASPS